MQAQSGSTTLPVISLTEAERFGSDDQKRLRSATHEYGFFHLVDHGVPPELELDLLDAARALFALPESEKAAIDMTRSPHFRGFTRLGGERTRGRADWREQIDIGAEPPAVASPVRDWNVLEGPNQWPASLPELRGTTERWHEFMADIARRLLRAWALSMGQTATVFDAAFGDRPSTLLKIIRYPATGAEHADGQGVGAHKDPGVLTLLWIEPGVGGLQVEHEGRWIDASPPPGALVVNIGELLEWATDGYLRASVHRVTSPSGGDRVSVPFFFNPALDARIPRLSLPPSLLGDARGVEADPSNPITDTFGANLLKARLRAHPDVAARHHPELVRRRGPG